MNSQKIWQPPRLRQDDESGVERHVTWLELFFDLVFVAAISELSHYLSNHLSVDGFLSVAIFFVPIWWCWVGATFYATRFDTDDLSDRLLTLLQMAIVMVMAVNIHHGLEKASSIFALCYISFRGILVLQYLYAQYHVPATRKLALWYAAGFSLSILFWGVSLLFPFPFSLIFWGFGLIIDFCTPLKAGRWVAQAPPSLSHIPERVGLFTIIVLGESVIGVVKGLSGLEWSLFSALTAFSGLCIAFSLWWLYFHCANSTPLQSMHQGKMSLGLAWLYAHLFLGMGLIGTGVGVEHMVMHPSPAISATPAVWLFCLSVSLCLITLSGIHRLSYPLGNRQFHQSLSLHHLGAATFSSVLIFAASSLSSLGLVMLMALVFIVQVGIAIAKR
ncbi:MAG: low temperature requirement protein A [Cyanobacteria bacterium P01_G01_bin.49]